MTKEFQIDSGILQYTPTGAYYEGRDEQFKRVAQLWTDLFNFDRTMFSLLTLLNGTGFSKGAMAHMVLSNPLTLHQNFLPIPAELSVDYESKIILHNLNNESMPRALKNLLMFTGTEGFPKINNARTRKIILEYIFHRDIRELDSMAVNFKGKLKKLIRHALGKQDLAKILNGDEKLFMKWIGKYNSYTLPVIWHVFDQDPPTREGLSAHLPQIEKYWTLRDAAKRGAVEVFRSLMKGFPQRTVIGFRNTFNLPIELSEIYETSSKSTKETIQLEAAAKRSGAKNVTVDWNKQELYDLWKSFYFKVLSNDITNIQDVEKAISEKSDKKLIDVGECVVVIDASRSMFGSDKRPLHPFLTSLCLVSTIDNIKDIFYVGGKIMKIPSTTVNHVLVPSNSTPLWKGLVNAVKTGVSKIIVISDGYENEIKGMFQHTYNHFINEGHKIDLLHLNPVFAADSKTGTARRLVSSVTPMPLADYRYLETELIFNQAIANRDMVKRLLVNKYTKLIK